MTIFCPKLTVDKIWAIGKIWTATKDASQNHRRMPPMSACGNSPSATRIMDEMMSAAASVAHLSLSPLYSSPSRHIRRRRRRLCNIRDWTTGWLTMEGYFLRQANWQWTFILPSQRRLCLPWFVMLNEFNRLRSRSHPPSISFTLSYVQICDHSFCWRLLNLSTKSLIHSKPVND